MHVCCVTSSLIYTDIYGRCVYLNLGLFFASALHKFGAAQKIASRKKERKEKKEIEYLCERCSHVSISFVLLFHPSLSLSQENNLYNENVPAECF